MGIIKSTLEVGTHQEFKGLGFFADGIEILYCGMSGDEKRFKLSYYQGGYHGFSPSIEYPVEMKEIKLLDKNFYVHDVSPKKITLEFMI